jgi:hypothetical protein
MNSDNDGFSFELVIDFVPGEGDPSRVFKAMSGLIDSMQNLDRHLMASIDFSLRPELVLDDVERGSLKARLRSVVEGIPDEALKEVEFKKILGPYLLKGKKAILNWCSENSEINSRESVRELEGTLLKLAEETDLKELPAYAPVQAQALLSDLSKMQESLHILDEGDNVTYGFDHHKIGLNKDLQISDQVVREVLTQQVIKSSSVKIIKVKKPDYLGKSMWEFVYDGRSIDAKVSHDEWLFEFQHKGLPVKPGDSLKVTLYEEISYGYEGEIVHKHYEIEKVHEVIKPPSQSGMAF